MKGFLYGQSEYNLNSSTLRLDDYVSLAKENSFDFLTITDNNLAGNYKFYTKCIAANIKPIIGIEYNIEDEDCGTSKVLLYAKNINGYKNLLKITSKQKICNINKLSDIYEYDDGILAVFVFNNSYLERLLFTKNYSALNEHIKEILKFKLPYVGLSFTNSMSKIDINKEMANYLKDFGVKTVPVHQCFYLKNIDIKVYKALVEIGGKKANIGEFDDYSFDCNPYQCKELDDFVSSINLELFKKRIALPKYPNTKGVSSQEYLNALCHKGLQKRGLYYPNYVQRLDYELSIINKMGYNDYFLIVWDFIKYAKNNDILVGPGRGSAAGSLVAYCLGITEIDPLKHDLLFERFLNPERVSMPDIDTDFPDIYRDKVIDYVRKLFGTSHVCNIVAYGTFQEKSAIRELARLQKRDNSFAETIIDMVEKKGFDSLLESYKDSELYDFIYVAKSLVDLPKHIGTHAAGIVLSDLPLTNIIPLQNGINGIYQSQLEAVDLEKIGLLKMDFLGIRNLTLISNMMKEIPGFDVNKLRNIPLDDKKTLKIFQTADTLGIFQFESEGMRDLLRKIKPTCFDDIVAAIALYRPGPMENIPQYIKAKHSGKIVYIHNDLQPILKDTYGIILYQEQIMKIAQVFAGYSLGEADLLRRAVSKKDKNAMQNLSVDFVDRSVKKGYSLDVAKQIYNLIYKFANYGFNKSHSVVYAIVSYQMAYFKANYFNVFMANILNNVIGNTQEMVSYIKYAKERGLNTFKPNINISSSYFVHNKYGLFIPFNAIYGIGSILTDQITKERLNGEFKSFDDFRKRMPSISSDQMEALIFSGCFDGLGVTKKSIINQSSKEDEVFLSQIENKVQDDNQDYDIVYLREKELKYLGMNIEYNLFKDCIGFANQYNARLIKQLTFDNSSYILAEFTKIVQIKTKKGDLMLVGTLEDGFSQINFVIFPKTYQNIISIEANKLYALNVVLNKDKKDMLNVIINNAIMLK